MITATGFFLIAAGGFTAWLTASPYREDDKWYFTAAVIAFCAGCFLTLGGVVLFLARHMP